MKTTLRIAAGIVLLPIILPAIVFGSVVVAVKLFVEFFRACFGFAFDGDWEFRPWD